MEQKIDAFNWDLRYFLSNLKAFRNDVNVSNKVTLNFILKVVDLIDEITCDSENNNNNNGTIDAFDWSTVNDELFEFKRSIFCRICKKSLPASGADYILHIADEQHQSALAANNQLKSDLPKVVSDCNNNLVVGPVGGTKVVSKVIPSSPWNSLDTAQPAPLEYSLFSKSVFSFADLICPNNAIQQTSAEIDCSAGDFATSNPWLAISPNISTESYNGDIVFNPWMAFDSKTRKNESPSQLTTNGKLFSAVVNRSLSSMRTMLETKQSSSISKYAENSPNGGSASPENKPSNQFETGKLSFSAVLNRSTTNEYTPSHSFFEGGLSYFLSSAISKGNNISQCPSHTVVAKEMKELLKSQFKSINCYLMGSRINGTTHVDDAPLDIYLDLDKSFSNDKAWSKFVDDMLVVKRLLDQNKGWSGVKLSERSRFGVLSAKHIATRITCCFAFGTGVFVKNHHVVSCFLKVQKICRDVILCIRGSLESKNEPKWTKKFTGYIISLLVIFYFQSTERLPSVKSLQEDCAPRQCGEDNVAFRSPTGVTVCQDRLSVLLIGFFEFYSKFDFAENIVSVYEGRMISHGVRSVDENSLSNTVLRFKRMIRFCPDRWKQSTMCVQDVFMHKHNAAESIHAEETKQFQQFCSSSLEILRESGCLIRY